MRLVRMDVGLSCGSGESCIFLNLSLPIAEEGASVFLSLFNLTFAMMKVKVRLHPTCKYS